MLLGFVLLAGLALATWWILEKLLPFLSMLDASVLAALVTGSLLASGAIYVKHVEHRHSVEAQFREAKLALFNDFMKLFNRITDEDIDHEEFVAELKRWKRKLLFWGGPGVLRAFAPLSHMQMDDTVGSLADSLGKLGTLILEMRKDVGLSNRGLVRETHAGISKSTILGARQILRNPDLFLECLRKDPSMPMSKLTAMEEAIDIKRGIV